MCERVRGKRSDDAEERHRRGGGPRDERKHGLPRLNDLQMSPAKVRFLSIEPLLEDLGEVNLEGISWVIVGGESGPGARPMDEEWVISIREQCGAARVPFFFKQWGGVRKKNAGRMLQGRTYDECPETKQNPGPAEELRLRYASQDSSTSLTNIGC